MVKRSSTATSLSVISAGPEDRARKVGVAYSITSRFLMLTSSPLHQRMIPYVSHPIYMHGIYRYKRSRLVRAEGCSNLVCGMYLKCRPVLKYTQSSHIGSIFQVQNHSAVGLCMVAQGEGAKVSGETAQLVVTTCFSVPMWVNHSIDPIRQNCCRNWCQFSRRLVEPSTLLQTPFPHFSLV